MAAKDRVDGIKSMLDRDQQVSVSELSRIFDVTEETIRRDLEKLENDGFLRRTYGGAIRLVPAVGADTHFYQRSLRRVKEKRAVAMRSLSLLEDHYAIAADSSTTVMEAVKLLRKHEGTTILTYSSAILHEMIGSKPTIVSTGGVLDKSTLSFTGQAAKDALSRYHVDIALFSCKGLDLSAGIFDSREGDADIKRCLFECADKLALLADHTKFDRMSFVHLAGYDRIDYIVTDREPSDAWKTLCGDFGIKLLF